MKVKIYLSLILAGFLFIAYWFIAHSYVFVRLTAVLGFLAVLALVAGIVVLFGRLK
jgi:hypothetical protein